VISPGPASKRVDSM